MSLIQGSLAVHAANEGSERVVFAMNAVEMALDRAGGVVEGDHGRELERLFERYARPVSYFFARRGFSPEECRDLTQETFLVKQDPDASGRTA